MGEDTESDRADSIDSDADHRNVVRDRYASIASDGRSCCDGSTVTTDVAASTDVDRRARAVGYSDDELTGIPRDANLGLGCGNPTAIANLNPGEVVLDLGSGAGFDCFLAAQEVGSAGRVIGVEMTPEMVEKARANATEASNAPVEFRLGEIEHLPVADGVVDVIISNCVINLSPNKQQVFDESFRVLAPGGRMAVTDVVRTTELPRAIESDPASISRCVAGAEPIETIRGMLEQSGFVDIGIEPKDDSDEFIREWDPERDLSEYLVSARFTAAKPSP